MNSLKDYLMIVYQLEENKYFLEQLIEKEENKKYTCYEEKERISNIKEEIKPDARLSEKVYVDKGEVKLDFIKKFGIVIVIAYIVVTKLAMKGLFWGVNYTLGEAIWAAIFSVTPIALIIYGIVYMNKYEKRYKKNEKEYRTAVKNWEARRERNKEDQKKSIEQINNKVIMCDKNVLEYKKQLEQVELVLQQYYRLELVYVKYHNFFAIGKLLEYIESGRCMELKGPNGAYNTYEQEIRMDTMLDKIDVVIKNLEGIRKQNVLLYQSLQDINNSLIAIEREFEIQNMQMKSMYSSIVKKIGNIEANQYLGRKINEINAYNIQQIAKYAEYQTFAEKQKRLEEGHWN